MPLRRAKGQQLGLDTAHQHRIGRLQRGHRMNWLDALELRHIVVAHADMPHFAGFHRVSHRAPAFFNVLVRLRPVHLIEINTLHTQPDQTLIDLGQHALTLDLCEGHTLIIPTPAALGGNNRAFGKAFDRLTHHLLRMAGAIHRRGVDPIHAEFQSAPDRRHRIAVILRAPTELPATAADGPCPQPDH